MAAAICRDEVLTSAEQENRRRGRKGRREEWGWVEKTEWMANMTYTTTYL